MSDEPNIPAEVLTLMRERVHSIEELELLLLLRAEPTRHFGVGELAAALKVSPEAVSGALARLVSAQLIQRVETAGTSPKYCYGPENEELARSVDDLALAYDRSRLEMLALIARNAIDRIRTDALKTFAEAFRLRGPKKDG